MVQLEHVRRSADSIRRRPPRRRATVELSRRVRGGGRRRLPVTPRLIARGGLHFDTTPTVDGFRDTTVPDANRLWIGLGASYEKSDMFSLDLAFNHVFFRDTTIALTRTFFDGTPLATTVNINSDVSSVVNTIAVDFRFRF